MDINGMFPYVVIMEHKDSSFEDEIIKNSIINNTSIFEHTCIKLRKRFIYTTTFSIHETYRNNLYALHIISDVKLADMEQKMHDIVQSIMENTDFLSENHEVIKDCINNIILNGEYILYVKDKKIPISRTSVIREFSGGIL